MEHQQEPLDTNSERQGANQPEQGASKMTKENDNSNGEGSGVNDSTEEKIRQLTQEVEDYKDKFLRNAAEMDNMRKRHAKERTDFIKFGAENLLRDMLPALDSLEQACQDTSGTQAAEVYHKGMQLVRKQLFDVLDRHGVKPLDAIGKPFDPNLHQAIQRVESDEVDADQVHQEFARGYLYNDRLLRPAMVAVAVPRKKSDQS